MNKGTFTSIFAAGLLVAPLLLTSSADARSGKEMKDGAPADASEASCEQRRAEARATLAEQLQTVRFLEGEWAITERYHKDGVAGEDQEGWVVFEPVLKGSALQHTYRGQAEGKTIEEIGLLTYNTYAERFEQTVMNSSHPMAKTFEGSQVVHGKLTLTFTKEHDGKVMTIRRSYERLDEDQLVGLIEVDRGEGFELLASEDYRRP